MDQLSAICVLGSANTDFNFVVNEFPKEGETISATRSFILNGGKGANQAVAAGRLLGGKVLFAGQMGQDDKSNSLEKEMNEAGCDVKYCRRLAGVDTGHAFIMINSKGENVIVIVGGANMHYDDLSKLPTEYQDAINNSHILLLQREIPNEINLLAAKYAKEKGKTVILDVGGRDEPLSEELLTYLDYLSPNDTELARLMKVDEKTINEQTIKDQLLKSYPNLKVLYKQGSKGSSLITKDFTIHSGNVASYNDKIAAEWKILNTVGAGDCLTGAFAAALYEKFIAHGAPENTEKAYREVLLKANTAAYISCTREGAMRSMPLKADVDDFTAKYLANVQL